MRNKIISFPKIARPIPGLFIVLAMAVYIIGIAAGNGKANEQAVYVGAQTCEMCHPEQYESFVANSSKAHSWKSIEKMIPKLTDKEVRECFTCHTTGYGEPGGFKSLDETPELANLSCETCHGPGSIHAESGDTEDILRTPDVKNCQSCHNPDRVQNFNFKPMLYHGGH